MYRRILVPVDGSAAADKGLVEAVKLAKESLAAIRVVHVIDQFIGSGFGPALYKESVVVDLRIAGARILSDAAAYVRGQDINVEVALVETKAERVAGIIIEEAKRWSADLISTGTHGRQGLTAIHHRSPAAHSALLDQENEV